MKVSTNRIEFTKQMKKDYTILIPNMAKTHFQILIKVFKSYGFNVCLLDNDDENIVSEGLKCVHNDTCYPALLTIGQMISALKSGKYDINKTALLMSQTGGGCRASNYIHLIRKALISSGMPQVPVISLSMSKLERNSGFKISLGMARRSLAALIYGDLLMVLKNKAKAYEKNKGESDALVEYWVDYISEQFEQKKAINQRSIIANMKKITDSFDSLELLDEPRVKVGIVGEIYVKYSPLANNNLEDFLDSEGCEVMLPPILGFMMHMIDNNMNDVDFYGGSKLRKFVVSKLFNFMERYEHYMLKSIDESKNFTSIASFRELKELVRPLIGHGCKMGEGWFLTAEMVELIVSGYENIVCTQPFGCLPNHIVGKAMIRPLKELYPQSNIVAIDYDPGATRVNQENRIKLMLSEAREKLSSRVCEEK